MLSLIRFSVFTE